MKTVLRFLPAVLCAVTLTSMNGVPVSAQEIAGAEEQQVVAAQCTAPGWSYRQQYNSGDEVFFKGYKWTSYGAPKGREPGKWFSWTRREPCTASSPVIPFPDPAPVACGNTQHWVPGGFYERGSLVEFNGKRWRSIVPLQDVSIGNVPGESPEHWREVGDCK